MILTSALLSGNHLLIEFGSRTAKWIGSSFAVGLVLLMHCQTSDERADVAIGTPTFVDPQKILNKPGTGESECDCKATLPDFSWRV